MADTALPLVSLCFVLLLPPLINAQSSCGGPCQTSGDCSGQLICTDGACNDDPSVGTKICSGGSDGGGDCQQSGTLTCGDNTYPTYSCSPSVTSPSTAAILTNNDFSAGGDGGARSECDQQFHSNTELVVALSTGWYDGGSRCNQTIVITAENGMSTTATVVDECDSMHGCDAEHASQPPCRYNIVDASNAVWEVLGLNTDVGQASITWTMA